MYSGAGFFSRVAVRGVEPLHYHLGEFLAVGVAVLIQAVHGGEGDGARRYQTVLMTDGLHKKENDDKVSQQQVSDQRRGSSSWREIGLKLILNLKLICEMFSELLSLVAAI